jgi:L-alanine-DL-glutamate epimerase-like enolase superfamily enzyme
MTARPAQQVIEGKIERVEVFALACDVPNGPVSTLALMPVRNGLLVRLTLDTGLTGWGEAWCNYPPKGNLSKLALFEGPIGETLLNMEIGAWSTLRPRLERAWARMIVHTGEPGPFNHCLSAIDMAAADLAARAQGISVAQLLCSAPKNAVGVYASSPRVEDPDSLAARLIEMGHTGVKLKVGFDTDSDNRLLERFRANDSMGMLLGIDANQNWTGPEARQNIEILGAHDLAFVEEPIFALDPLDDWAEVARAAKMPIAAGENISSPRQFADMVRQGGLGVVQPDVAKWGGISGVVDVARDALTQDAQVMLHYMGTALGLAASLHVMAALDCDGRVELDANPNPLRTDLGDINLRPDAGKLPLPSGPGFGFEPCPDALRRFCVAQTTLTRK